VSCRDYKDVLANRHTDFGHGDTVGQEKGEDGLSQFGACGLSRDASDLDLTRGRNRLGEGDLE
jgi:hypothetical protein